MFESVTGRTMPLVRRLFCGRVAGIERNMFAGTVRDDELGLLRSLVQESSHWPGPIIEIGTLFGFTTLKMATWAEGKLIISVDNYSWNPVGLSRAAHKALVGRILFDVCNTARVKLLDAEKNVYYVSYSGERPALVFLDADHTFEETAKDIEWARRVGARIVAGHDYAPEFEGVRRAVDAAGGPCRLQGSLWALGQDQGTAGS